MDQQRFDRLAGSLAAGITRRGLVGNLTGAALGGPLVAAGAGDAEARKKKRRGGKRKRPRVQCATCSETCPGAAESTPTKTVSFTPIDNPDYCGIAVDLTGFAGCTQVTARFWSAINEFGFRARDNGDVALGPTNPAGSSRTMLGTYAKGGAVDIRLASDAPNYRTVDC